jgi:hypothetical protein
MPGNHFDTPVIVDNGIGSVADPVAYFGLGVNPADTSDSLGPRIYSGTGDPVVTPVTAPLGSIWIRTDAFGIFFLTAAPNIWTQLTVP